MDIISDPDDMQGRARQWRSHGLKVVLVPTMGFFHPGHRSLMEYGRTIGERLVVSLFVNPAQFGPQEDLERYPRDLDRDVRLARDAGVDCLYTLGAGAMYPPGYQTYVEVESLSQGLCGASRPGHFKGVATVVLKLLNQVSPHVAVFGEKDYQQLMVIRRMAADLDLDTEIVGRPIVREPDGLAMSSRNTYLSPEERAAALCLYRALLAARELVASGARSRENILAAVGQIINAAPGTRIDYVALVDPTTLQEVEAIRGEARLLLAVWLNQTRLIDNTLLSESLLCCV
ncbi:MAG: pantoate--beta-alanine ligase [Proteobacteria bacterium]|nr:pantoate--beta-alanine ligase [Pseudomonadota bacterium]MBU4447838.1 pantoate--beta-alanine ligase [Pseudomonadota bacterium]